MWLRFPILFRNQLPRDKSVTRGGRFRVRIATGSVDPDVSQGSFQGTDPLVLPFGCPEI